mgnify:CR=1 FL=1
MTTTPGFTGLRAVILHRANDDVQRLTRQLGVLGLDTHVQWQPLKTTATADLVLVDADAGWAGILPWEREKNPVPLIALLSSEAPGRVAWALDHGANALISKPVAASAVYPALVMAFRFHAQSLQVARELDEMRERLRLRPLVLAAVQALMQRFDLDEAAAYRQLRQQAMQSQLALEHVAADVLSLSASARAAK